MPLVEYSDSEGSEPSCLGDTQSRGTKRKRTSEDNSSLPPLPDTFHDLYASTSRLSNQDDPSLHGGRQRVTPHVDGNWPTHVYIECMFLLIPIPITVAEQSLTNRSASFNRTFKSPE